MKAGKKDKAAARIEGPEGMKLIRQIEYYHDPKIDRPEAFSRFLGRLGRAEKEVGRPFQSFVFDSVSLASLLGRKWHQYELDSGSQDPRKWYGGATDLLEEILMVQLPAIVANVGVAFHVSRTKIEAEGTMVRAPLAPGRLLNMVAAAWPELWRLYTDRDEAGKKVRIVQTEGDEKWQAGTQIGVEDGIAFRSAERFMQQEVWQQWEGERPPLHLAVYGDPGAGKSHLLAAMPPPVCVWMWDSVGKEMPYMRAPKGMVVEVGPLELDQFGTRVRRVWGRKEGKGA